MNTEIGGDMCYLDFAPSEIRTWLVTLTFLFGARRSVRNSYPNFVGLKWVASLLPVTFSSPLSYRSTAKRRARTWQSFALIIGISYPSFYGRASRFTYCCSHVKLGIFPWFCHPPQVRAE